MGKGIWGEGWVNGVGGSDGGTLLGRGALRLDREGQSRAGRWISRVRHCDRRMLDQQVLSRK